MSDDAKKWSQVVDKLRRALGLAPPSWKEADAEMVKAEAVPMTDEEIERIAGGAKRQEDHENYELEADYTWASEYASEEVAEEMLVLNRDAGDEDPEIDDLVDKHRKEALRDAAEEDDETKLEGRGK